MTHRHEIVPLLPMPDYMAAPGISKHALDLFAECPEKYQLRRDGLFREKTSAAMQFGRCVHSAVFESRRDYHVKPATYGPQAKPWNGNATECKDWLATHSDKPVLSMSEDAWIDAACAKIRSDRRAAGLIGAGMAELSIFTTDDETGLQLKGRPDWVSLDYKSVVDLKTISDASERNVSREIAERRYHLQAAMYFKLLRAHGHEPESFYFIFIETGDIPLLNVRKLRDSSIQVGEMLLCTELEQLADCITSNCWPGYSGGGSDIAEISVPDWAMMMGETELTIGGQKHAL